MENSCSSNQPRALRSQVAKKANPVCCNYHTARCFAFEAGLPEGWDFCS